MTDAVGAVHRSKLVMDRVEKLPELLSRKEVMTFLGLYSRSALRAMIAQGKFPQPMRINQRLHRWRRRDVVHWYESNEDWSPPGGGVN